KRLGGVPLPLQPAVALTTRHAPGVIVSAYYGVRKREGPTHVSRGFRLPLQDSNLGYLIQSGDPRIRSSDKSLSNREFATSAVGKKARNVGGCRGQRGQKRCQCAL